jgi:hypothetical protein
VVECPGKDRIWLDASAALKMRKRELYAGNPEGKSPNNPPAASVRYELSDHREVTPGGWLPWRCRRTAFALDPATGAPMVLTEAWTNVREAEANRVPDDTFRFTPPPGTLIQNRDTLEVTRVPGGLSFLDEVIDSTRANLPAAEAPSGRTAGAWKMSLLIGLNGLMAGLVVWQLYRVTRSGLRIRPPAEIRSRPA